MTDPADYISPVREHYLSEERRTMGVGRKDSDIGLDEFAEVFMKMANDITKAFDNKNVPTEVMESHFSLIAAVVAELRGKNRFLDVQKSVVDRRPGSDLSDPAQIPDSVSSDDGDLDQPSIMSGY